jgi:copper chaperone
MTSGNPARVMPGVGDIRVATSVRDRAQIHRSRSSGWTRGETGMGNSTATYTVVGMTCNGCVNKVTNAVTGVEGVDDIDVDVSTGTLEVIGQADDAAIRDAVAQAGYKIAN